MGTVEGAGASPSRVPPLVFPTDATPARALPRQGGCGALPNTVTSVGMGDRFRWKYLYGFGGLRRMLGPEADSTGASQSVASKRPVAYE